MSTYKLWELTSTREEVYSLAQGVVEELYSKDQWAFSGDTWDETSQALVYAVHYELWNGIKHYDPSIAPFTHRVNRSVIAALRTIVPNHDALLKSESRDDIYRLSRSIYAVLSQARLLGRVGKSRTHYIREWPAGFVPGYVPPARSVWLSQKDRHDIEKQAERAVKLAGPVVVSFDLDSIPLPDPSPKSILDYTKKVISAAKRLQIENRELREKLARLEESGQWEDVVEDIAAALK